MASSSFIEAPDALVDSDELEESEGDEEELRFQHTSPSKSAHSIGELEYTPHELAMRAKDKLEDKGPRDIVKTRAIYQRARVEVTKDMPHDHLSHKKSMFVTVKHLMHAIEQVDFNSQMVNLLRGKYEHREDDAPSLKKGILTVKIVSAHNLHDTWGDLPNAYVQMSLASSTYRTSTCQSKTNPVWNRASDKRQFSFIIHPAHTHRELTLEVMSDGYDQEGDVNLGSVTIDVHAFPWDEWQNQRLLLKEEGNPNGNAELVFEIRFARAAEVPGASETPCLQPRGAKSHKTMNHVHITAKKFYFKRDRKSLPKDAGNESGADQHTSLAATSLAAEEAARKAARREAQRKLKEHAMEGFLCSSVKHAKHEGEAVVKSRGISFNFGAEPDPATAHHAFNGKRHSILGLHQGQIAAASVPHGRALQGGWKPESHAPLLEALPELPEHKKHPHAGIPPSGWQDGKQIHALRVSLSATSGNQDLIVLPEMPSERQARRDLRGHRKLSAKSVFTDRNTDKVERKKRELDQAISHMANEEKSNEVRQQMEKIDELCKTLIDRGENVYHIKLEKMHLGTVGSQVLEQGNVESSFSTQPWDNSIHSQTESLAIDERLTLLQSNAVVDALPATNEQTPGQIIDSIRGSIFGGPSADTQRQEVRCIQDAISSKIREPPRVHQAGETPVTLSVKSLALSNTDAKSETNAYIQTKAAPTKLWSSAKKVVHSVAMLKSVGQGDVHMEELVRVEMKDVHKDVEIAAVEVAMCEELLQASNSLDPLLIVSAVQQARSMDLTKQRPAVAGLIAGLEWRRECLASRPGQEPDDFLQKHACKRGRDIALASQRAQQRKLGPSRPRQTAGDSSGELGVMSVSSPVARQSLTSRPNRLKTLTHRVKLVAALKSQPAVSSTMELNASLLTTHFAPPLPEVVAEQPMHSEHAEMIDGLRSQLVALNEEEDDELVHTAADIAELRAAQHALDKLLLELDPCLKGTADLVPQGLVDDLRYIIKQREKDATRPLIDKLEAALNWKIWDSHQKRRTKGTLKSESGRSNDNFDLHGRLDDIRDGFDHLNCYPWELNAVLQKEGWPRELAQPLQRLALARKRHAEVHRPARLHRRLFPGPVTSIDSFDPNWSQQTLSQPSFTTSISVYSSQHRPQTTPNTSLYGSVHKLISSPSAALLARHGSSTSDQEDAAQLAPVDTSSIQGMSGWVVARSASHRLRCKTAPSAASRIRVPPMSLLQSAPRPNTARELEEATLKQIASSAARHMATAKLPLPRSFQGLFDEQASAMVGNERPLSASSSDSSCSSQGIGDFAMKSLLKDQFTSERSDDVELDAISAMLCRAGRS